jgi:hypothetical protein
MNTFLNIAQESNTSDLTRVQLLSRLNGSLHDKINSRGHKEQFTSVLLQHYYPNENVAKRRCKGTKTSGAEFFLKIFAKVIILFYICIIKLIIMTAETTNPNRLTREFIQGLTNGAKDMLCDIYEAVDRHKNNDDFQGIKPDFDSVEGYLPWRSMYSILECN